MGNTRFCRSDPTDADGGHFAQGNGRKQTAGRADPERKFGTRGASRKGTDAPTGTERANGSGRKGLRAERTADAEEGEGRRD